MVELRETLPKDLLQRLYVEEGLTETEIAHRFSTYQVKVGRLRKSYGIPTISKGQRLGLPEELTPRLKSILVGSMLGDGGLQRTGGSTARYVEHHSVKQRAYLDWKAREWGPFVTGVSPSDKGAFKGFRLITHGCPVLHPYFRLFYPSGEGNKTFGSLPLDWVDDLALAVWFMDDGSRTRHYLRLSIGPSPEDQRVQLRILKSLGIEGKLYTRGDPAIHIQGRTPLNRFLERIRPHLHSSMLYKLDIPLPKPGKAPRDLLTSRNLQPFLDSGSSLQDISRAFGVSRSSVGRALGRMGVPSRPPGRPSGRTTLTPEAAKIALQQLDGGLEDFQSKALQILLRTRLPEPAFSDEEVQSDWRKLREASTELVGESFVGGTYAGTKLCQKVFPYRWDARYQKNPSLRESWKDPRYLKRAIQFQVSVGDPVTPTRVLRALQAVVRAPTNFRPCFAKALTKAYCPEGGLVLDPCAGYGGRATGVLAAGRRYLGVDPHPEAGEAFSALSEIVGPLEFHRAPFEDVDLEGVLADLVLTSPPYFSVERYSEDPTQSWVRYPTWEVWVRQFLGTLIAKSGAHLRAGGVFCLNLKNVRIGRTLVPLADEAVRISVGEGFELIRTLSLPLGRIGKNAQGEPVFVFRRI